MSKNKGLVAINESIAFKTVMKQFVEDNIVHLKHVYHNFDKIIFLKSMEQKKHVEIFKVEDLLELIFPEHLYIIVLGDSFNDLIYKQQQREMFHVLAHIPHSFNGELREHDIEAFVGEAKLFKEKDNRLYVMNHDPELWGVADEDGNQKAKKNITESHYHRIDQ